MRPGKEPWAYQLAACRPGCGNRGERTVGRVGGRVSGRGARWVGLRESSAAWWKERRARVDDGPGLKSKRQGATNRADPGRKRDGRVQPRMERTLGAITLSNKSMRSARLSPFQSFGD